MWQRKLTHILSPYFRAAFNGCYGGAVSTSIHRTDDVTPQAVLALRSQAKQRLAPIIIMLRVAFRVMQGRKMRLRRISPSEQHIMEWQRKVHSLITKPINRS